MIVDGKALAKDIGEDLKKLVSQCSKQPILGLLMIAPTAASKSFVRIKNKKAEYLGIRVLQKELSDGVSQEEATAVLQELIEKSDGVVIQQPVPKYLDSNLLCSHIPPEKDIDALTEKSTYTPPVAGAVQEILNKYKVDVSGTNAVVIGEGALVGKPVAALLKKLGAEVAVMTKETGIDREKLLQADIVVSGAGKADLIRKDMLKPEAVVIDAGTSESRGSLRGDVHLECYEHVRLISPVPGGVGPLTVISLFKNLIESASCSS